MTTAVPILRLHQSALVVRAVLAAAAIAVAASAGAAWGNVVEFALGALIGWAAHHRRAGSFGRDDAEVSSPIGGVALEPYTRTFRRAAADQLFLLVVAVPLTSLDALGVAVIFGGAELGLALRSARMVVRTRAEQARRGATRLRIDNDPRVYSRTRNSKYLWLAASAGSTPPSA